MVTTALKQKIAEALQERRGLFSGSDAKFAVSIEINTAQYSRIKNGDYEKVLSDAAWIRLARLTGVQFGNSFAWQTARTPFFDYVTGQLEFCQQNAASRLLCDVADIGKTHAAKVYVSTHKNAVYVDCSQVKSKQKFIRFLAKEFGVSHQGRYADVYEDLVFYLRQLENPFVVVDEAGDLKYEAFLELKALWNATERVCGWYMMGADGLKRKIERSIISATVGYAEIFSRFGNRYQKYTPDGSKELQEVKRLHAAMIIKANFPEGANINAVLKGADGSLRRLIDERKKLAS